jgi:hypothetical protein
MERQCLRRISLVALALAWVRVAGAGAEQPKSGGTLRVALEADITGLDPAIPGVQNYYVNQNLFTERCTQNLSFGCVPAVAGHHAPGSS